MKKDYQPVIEKIKELKDIKPRSEWKTLNRDLLLSKIKPTDTEAVKLSWLEYGHFFTNFFRQRLLEPAVVILLVLGFSVGSSLIVNAAFYSLPGDSLYRMKIALENTQLAITPSEEKKIELKIEFAQKRIEEFNKIVSQTNIDPASKKEKINVAIREFKRNVAAVNEHVVKNTVESEKVPDTDKEKNLRIATVISSKTEELAKSLDEKVQSLPELEKAELKELVAEAVEKVQEINLSTQEIIKGSQPEGTATSTGDIIDSSQGSNNGETASSTTTIDVEDVSQGGEGTEVETEAETIETTPDVVNSN